MRYHSERNIFHLAGCSQTEKADAAIQDMVNSVKSFVESSKGTSYTKFEAVSYCSQVVTMCILNVYQSGRNVL